jgi:hypothetical protein
MGASSSWTHIAAESLLAAKTPAFISTQSALLGRRPCGSHSGSPERARKLADVCLAHSAS